MSDFIVTVFPTQGHNVQRFNFANLIDAVAFATVTHAKSTTRKVELAVIVHVWKR